MEPTFSTRKKAGWGRRLWVGGIGCLGLIVLIVAVSGVALLGSWVSMSKRGEPTSAPTERAVSLPAVDISSSEPGDPPPLASTKLNLYMQGGIFRIEPGPPGSDIRVEGAFAEQYYQLTEERRPVGETGSEVVIRFEPTASVLTRALAGLQVFNRQHPNQLTVFIPRDHPIDLTLQLLEGQSDIELGGLMLTDANMNISRGAHEISFSEPIVGELGHLLIAGGMGQVTFNDLGNARFRELTSTTSMGQCHLDLGGEWEAGTLRKALISHRMGQMELLVPDGVRVTDGSTSRALFGSTSGLRRFKETDDPDAPALELNARVAMGDYSVRSR